jgi:SH3-like domain-containing protein
VAARAENTVLQIVGPDAMGDGRVWRQVQDAQGNRGWVPADFLVAAAPPGT